MPSLTGWRCASSGCNQIIRRRESPRHERQTTFAAALLVVGENGSLRRFQFDIAVTYKPAIDQIKQPLQRDLVCCAGLCVKPIGEREESLECTRRFLDRKSVV